MATTIQDPTRAELIAFIEGVYPSVTCEGEPHTEAQHDECIERCCGCRFDIEEAAYWLAAHYHGGQASNLYAALSASEFRPGCASDLPEDLEDENCERVTATMLYLEGESWLKGLS